jgi:lipopolysaccharide transport protein LptA
MKLRRIIPASIVAIGGLILLLAFFGVFAPSRTTSGPDVTEPGTSDVPGKTTQLQAKGFRSKGDNWILTAPAFTVDKDRNLLLENPVLIATQPKDETDEDKNDVEPTRMEIRAKKAIYTQQPQARIAMSGAVWVKVTGEYPGELRTESLEVEPDRQKAWSKVLVEITVKTPEGQQSMSGEGASIDYEQRIMRIEKNIRLELSGGQALLPDEGLAGKSPKASPASAEKPSAKQINTIITADGPCVADGFKSTVVLENNVVVQQGKGQLDAKRVVAFIDEENKTLKRFQAEGKVRFRAEGVEGSGESLVRTGVDNRIILTGAPAIIQQAQSSIQSRQIELDPESGRVEVTGGGELVLKPDNSQKKKDDKKRPMGPVKVHWSKRMYFDRGEHEAAFYGDVAFSQEESTITCDGLTVQFDETNSELLEARAVKNVRVKGRLGDMQVQKGRESDGNKPKGKAEEFSASCGEMVLRPADETVVFDGDVKLTYGPQTVSGKKVIFKQNPQSLRVPSAGKMVAIQERDGQTTEMSVSWKGEMDYSLDKGSATFLRDVVLDAGPRRLNTHRLTVEIDKDNNLRGLLADGGASFVDKGDVTKNIPARSLKAKHINLEMGDGNELKSLKARGNVVMAEEPLKDSKELGRSIKSDELIVTMGKGNVLEKLDAIGNARVVQGDMSAQGDNIELRGEGDAIRMRGPGILRGKRKPDDVKKGEPTDMSVAWTGGMTYARSKGEATFRRDVVMTYGERTLSSQTVVAHISKTNEIEYFEAKGGAVLKDGDRAAEGTGLVWDMKKDEGRLVGKPAAVRMGKERLFGDEIVFTNQGKEVRVKSRQRVEGRIQVGNTIGDLIPR